MAAVQGSLGNCSSLRCGTHSGSPSHRGIWLFAWLIIAQDSHWIYVYHEFCGRKGMKNVFPDKNNGNLSPYGCGCNFQASHIPCPLQCFYVMVEIVPKLRFRTSGFNPNLFLYVTIIFVKITNFSRSQLLYAYIDSIGYKIWNWIVRCWSRKWCWAYNV